MPHWHRFFFIAVQTVLLSVIFVFGITILPIIYGIRFACARAYSPEAPKRPVPPQKPDKPIEPAIGAGDAEWANHRKRLNEYRSLKRDWKKKVEWYKANEHRLEDEYQRRRHHYESLLADHKANVEEPLKDNFCDYWQATTFHILFCAKQRPRLVGWFLDGYSNKQ
ncbi:MAG: hypothetical protein P4M11_08350 [Candidatus Pacebacteria bacterium]|nr:hypothetical protein [Candidatus Paceibacterota bacterium]